MKGHITVYFSLLLLILLSLLCTVIESARLGGVRIRCQASAYLALESVFADYYQPAAREYGLLMLDKSYGTDSAEAYQGYFLDYIACNAAANQGLLVRGADFCQVQTRGVSLVSERRMTDEGGQVLEEEILAYMRYAAPAGLLEWVMERLGLLEQSEVVTEIFEKLSELEEQAAAVDYSIQRMYHGLNQIKGFQMDVEGAADRIKSAVDELEELYEEYDEAETDRARERLQRAINTVERSIALQVQDLVQSHNTLLGYNGYVAEQRGSYERNTGLVGKKLEIMEQLFARGREQLDEGLREAVEKELSDIRIYSAGETDYYEVEDGTQDIRPNMGILEGNIRALTPYMSGGTGGLRAALDSCVSAMESYRTENMELNYIDEAVSGRGEDVMSRIRRLLGNGLLGLVAENPSDLSDREFRPERFYEELLGGYAYTEEELGGQILVNEYLLNRFGNLLEPAEGKLLAYELEYILAGRESDRQNLAVVASELLALRGGLNFIYLMGCAEKRAEAEGLAVLLVGYTGIHGIIKVTQLLILLAWAQAEGIADVRALFAGKRVPLAKDDSSWSLSLTGLTRLSASGLSRETGEAEGLTYQEYLRLLLLREERYTRNGRAMDLMEGVIREKYDGGFSLQDCVRELAVRTEFEAKPVFLSLPFTRKGEEYRIEGISSYTY